MAESKAVWRGFGRNLKWLVVQSEAWRIILHSAACTPKGGIWAAARRGNLIVSFANSEQFIIIVLLIRPFPEKIDTKSLLSLLVIVLVIVIIHKK